MRTATLKLALLTLVAVFALPLAAASQSWTGDSGVNIDWTHGQNWINDPGNAEVPGMAPGDTATFPVGMITPNVNLPAGSALPNPVNMTVESDVTISVAAGEVLSVMTLTVHAGQALTLSGSGEVQIASIAGSGSLNVNAASLTVSITGNVDLTALAAFSNLGQIEVVGNGLTLTTATGIDLGNFAIGDGITTTSATINGALESTGTLRSNANALLTANGPVNVARLECISLSDSAMNDTLTVGTQALIGGGLTASDVITFNAADVQLQSSSTLVTQAGARVDFLGGGTLTVDRSSSNVFSDGLVVGAAGLTIQDSDGAGVGSGSPTMTVNGDLVVNGDLNDQKINNGFDYAVVLVISANVNVADTAGISLVLDESSLSFGGAVPRSMNIASLAANFDGAIALGALTLDTDLAIQNFPSGTDLSIGDLTLNNAADLLIGDYSVVLAGEYTNGGNGSITVQGGTLRPGADFRAQTSITFPSIVLEAGESAQIAGQASVTNDVVIPAGATLSLAGAGVSDNSTLNVGGDLLINDGGNLNVGTSNAANITATLNVTGDTLINDGTLNAGGEGDPATTNSGNTVALNFVGGLTLGSSVGGTDGNLVMFADGTSGNGTSNLTLDGNLVLETAGSSMTVGEGALSFGSDLDFSAATEGIVVNAAALMSSTPTTIALTKSGAVALALSTSGTRFFVTSLGANTSVTQSGQLVMIGDLELRGSDESPVWDAQAGAELIAGELLSPRDVAIRYAGGDVAFGAVSVGEVNTGDATTENRLTFIRDSGAQGSLTIESITLDGDTQDTDPTAGLDEENSGKLVVSNADLTVNQAITLNDGADLGTEDGLGGQLHINDSTVVLLDNINVGNGTGGAATAGCALEVSNSTLRFGSGTVLSTAADSTLSLNTSVATSNAGDSWSLVCHFDSNSVRIIGSQILAGSAGDLTLLLGAGGEGITLLDSDFSNYSAQGMQFQDDSAIFEFARCTFSNGQAGGSHITTLGDIGSPTDTRVNADLIIFDASTLGGSFGSIATDTGNIVSIADELDEVRLTLRASAQSQSFGNDGALDLTPAMGEDDDADGTESVLAGDSDDDLIWTVQPTLAAALAGKFAQAAPLLASDGAAQTGLLFDLTAEGGSTTIEMLELDIDESTLSSGGVATGAIDSLTLFIDNGLTNGVFDGTDTVLAQSDGSTLSGSGSVIFDFSATPATIADATTEIWGVQLTLDAGSAGALGLSFAAADITLPTGDERIFTGLPLQSDINIAVGNLTILANQENGDPTDTAATTIDREHPLVLAFDVENNAAASTTAVTGVDVVVTASAGSLTNTELSQLFKFAVLFVSTDNSFDTTYSSDVSAGFGQAGDDQLFDFVTGGGAEVVFSGTPAVATMRFERLGSTPVPPGETRSYFLVFDGTDDNGLATKAEGNGVGLRFSVREDDGRGSGIGLVTTNGASDEIAVSANETPPDSRVASGIFRVRAFVDLSGGGGGSCALQSGGNLPLSFLWLLALLLGLVALHHHRNHATQT